MKKTQGVLYGTHTPNDTIYRLPPVRIGVPPNAASHIPHVHTPAATGGFQPKIPRVQRLNIQLLPTIFQLRAHDITLHAIPAPIGPQYGTWGGKPRQYVDLAPVRPTNDQITEIVLPQNYDSLD